jgi:hypothetical protein
MSGSFGFPRLCVLGWKTLNAYIERDAAAAGQFCHSAANKPYGA